MSVYVEPRRRPNRRVAGFLIRKGDAAVFVNDEEFGELIGELHRVNARLESMDMDELEEVSTF